MLKKSYIFAMGILFSLVLIGFTSCKQLWDINPGVTDVSIQLQSTDIFTPQLNEIGGENSEEVTELTGLYIPSTATVTLYDAKTDKVIASQNVSFESIETIEVTLDNIPVNKTVYATIEIFGENHISIMINPETGESIEFYMDPTLFRARSKNTKIKASGNNLVAQPNAVYLYPYNPDADQTIPPGDDTHSGLNALDPVASLDRAMEILKTSGTIMPGATIYLKGAIDFSDTENKAFDGEGVTIKKFADFSEPMIYYYSSQETNEEEEEETHTSADIHLKNLTIDGNKEFLKDSPNNYTPLLEIGGSLYLEDTKVINSCIGGIRIYNSESETTAIYLKGNVVIKGNTTDNDYSDDSGNLGYTNDPNIPSIIVTGPLTGGKDSIGLSPDYLCPGIIIAEGGSVDNPNTPYKLTDKDIKNFFFDAEDYPLVLLEESNTAKIPCDEVFVDGTYGDDSFSGSSPYDYVRTFETAKSLLTTGNGTIWVMGAISPDREDDNYSDAPDVNEKVWRADPGKEIVIKRFGGDENYTDTKPYTGNLISVGTTSYDLVLENIVIDGNTENVTADQTGELITVESGSKLIINEGAVIQNNDGAAAVNTDGEVTMNGGSIINNRGTSVGGVYIGNSGYFNLHEGIISENQGTTGGGLFLEMATGGGATLVMTGGEISNNTSSADNSSAGIYCEDGFMDISGGKIVGNNSTGNNSAGAINAGIEHNNDGTNVIPLKISGNPVITGNTVNEEKNNITVDSSPDSKPGLKIIGELTGNSGEIGITHTSGDKGAAIATIERDQAGQLYVERADLSKLSLDAGGSLEINLDAATIEIKN